jgi:hypothetical protein
MSSAHNPLAFAEARAPPGPLAMAIVAGLPSMEPDHASSDGSAAARGRVRFHAARRSRQQELVTNAERTVSQ